VVDGVRQQVAAALPRPEYTALVCLLSLAFGRGVSSRNLRITAKPSLVTQLQMPAT